MSLVLRTPSASGRMLEVPAYVDLKDRSIHKQHCDEYYTADAGLMLSFDPVAGQYEENLSLYYHMLYVI